MTKSIVGFEDLKSAYDIIVAGGGTGGFCAAIQAGRKGCTVLLVEETDWLGGQMSAAGVSTMDEGTPAIRQHGIYKEFYERVVDHYKKLNKTTGTCYYSTGSFAMEPHVSQKIIYDLISDVNENYPGEIYVLFYSVISEAYKQEKTVSGVRIETNSPDFNSKDTKNIDCFILIDSTEYGDVIPLTGSRYYIAKHTSDNYDENSLVQEFTWTAILKEYKSGVPDNLRLKTSPPGYNEFKVNNKFAHIKRYSKDYYNVYSEATSWSTVSYYRGMPDSGMEGDTDYTTKTEINISQNDISVTVGDVLNLKLRWDKDIELHLVTLSFLYYLQHELKLDWSVAIEEGYDTPFNRYKISQMIKERPEMEEYRDILVHFPVMPYVRESRRIIGLHTVVSTEIDRTKGPLCFKDAITINDYPEDLHGSKRPEDMDIDIDKGGLTSAEVHDWGSRIGPFQLPFRAFVPEITDGFLVAEKNFSQSRLVNGATRLQPSTMLNGQVVGNIAALAVKYKNQPRNLPYMLVQIEQLNSGAPLWIKNITDIPKNCNAWKTVQFCLVHGLLKLEGGRFFPQDPILNEEIEKILSENDINGYEIPDNIITKLHAAEYLMQCLIKKHCDIIPKSCR